MNISDLTKTSLMTSPVTNVAGDSFRKQSSVTTGNSLPDARQVRVEAPLVTDSVPFDSEELNKLVAQVNMTLQGRFSDLKFTVAEGTDINVVRIEDAETGKLIRQIPSEAVVAIARALDKVQRGMMFEEKI